MMSFKLEGTKQINKSYPLRMSNCPLLQRHHLKVRISVKICSDKNMNNIESLELLMPVYYQSP